MRACHSGMRSEQAALAVADAGTAVGKGSQKAAESVSDSAATRARRSGRPRRKPRWPPPASSPGWAARSPAVLSPGNSQATPSQFVTTLLSADASRPPDRIRCASIWSIRATSPSAPPSSRRAGCSSWRPRRRPGHGTPVIVDETLEPFDPETVSRRRRGRHRHPHRQRPARLRGRRLGARARRLGRVRRHPRDALSRRMPRARRRRTRWCAATAISIWADGARRLRGRRAAAAVRRRPGGRRRVPAGAMGSAQTERYMWGSVQTVRGCPKHCSFCSVWRTDGQKPRQRGVERRGRGDRGAAQARLPVHRARRRQLLPGDARRSRDGGAQERHPAAGIAHRRRGRSDSS